MKRTAQTPHFKVFWIRPASLSGTSSSPRGPILTREPSLKQTVLALGSEQPLPTRSVVPLQTVIPKRLLKKAVDRNGLRRVMREATRGCPGLGEYAQDQDLSALRMTLLSAKGFSGEPSRKALKHAWRDELDRLLTHLAS